MPLPSLLAEKKREKRVDQGVEKAVGWLESKMVKSAGKGSSRNKGGERAREKMLGGLRKSIKGSIESGQHP